MSNVGKHNYIKDVSQNWILTVIDNFSKYVFAVPLPNKSAETILKGFQDIVNNQAEGTTPKTLQTDNGSEFVNSIIQGWAREENIHLSRSATYQATSNALIENFNNILRKMIREGCIRNNSLSELGESFIRLSL
jgi:transposase InsO family protein